MASYREIYNNSPLVLQDAIVTLRGFLNRRVRYDSIFHSRLDSYLTRDEWDAEGIAAYRLAQVSLALERASRSRFYRELFSEMKADWRDFVDPQAFVELPILKKSDIVPRLEDFRTRPTLPGDRTVSTSGTTGASFTFPVSAEVVPDQWAVWWRYWSRHGLHRGMRAGIFASAPIVGTNASGRPFRRDWANNHIRFSIFHINESNIFKYVEAFSRYNIKWIHGNPTAIARFCQIYLSSGFSDRISVEHLTVGSENLMPWQIGVMNDVFGLRPKQHYGLVEAVANISELPDGRMVVDEDHSYVEFVRDEASGLSRIVGTSFSNTALALLRYDTGDLCVLHKDSDEGGVRRCVSSLDGRATDYIVLPSGARVASLAGPFHVVGGLAGAQIVQHPDLSLTINYIPGHDWHEGSTLVRLESEIRLRLGEDIDINFMQVKSIPVTKRGKTKLVVSEIAND